MVTAGIFLRFSLCASLVLVACGFPTKGSKSQDQSSGPQTGHSGGHHESMSHRAVQGPSFPQPVSASGGVSSVPAAGYPGGAVLLPVPAGYAASSQPEAAQSEPRWSVPPRIFSEEGLANTEAVGSSDGLPAAPPPPPSGPVLQSGETSNVVREAELGNYHHETEEIGYPAERMRPGQVSSYPVPFMPVGFGGYPGLYPYPSPYPYPVFDYMLLYGLYPPGTYTTFSKNHEKGKDYYQNIHYLKEHGPGGPGFGQKKVFQ